MNIWCISKYASPEKYSKISARFFYLTDEFNKLGHNTILITSDSNHLATFPKTDKTYNFEKIDNVPVYWIKTKKYTKTASIGRVLSWFDFERKLFNFNIKHLDKPNVVIISSLSIFTILYGYYLKKKFGSFLVFEIRDIWPLTMVEEGGFSRWHPLVLLLGLIEKFGYKKSDLIVGTMPRLDIHIKNVLGKEQPFFCSPLGFNPENYTEDNLSEIHSFKEIFPSNKIVIGYAGSMGITNALETLIETIKLLKDDNRIFFALVGSGDLRSEYEDHLRTCKNVIFLPRIEQKKVKYFLAACDILYLSTKDSKVWEYGQSMNKIVEYMLASRPIIASYSGFPSMINEANCGIYLKSADSKEVKKAILEMASKSVLEKECLGSNGRNWIYDNRQYNMLAKAYIEKIESMINKGLV